MSGFSVNGMAEKMGIDPIQLEGDMPPPGRKADEGPKLAPVMGKSSVEVIEGVGTTLEIDISAVGSLSLEPRDYSFEFCVIEQI